MVNPVKQIGRYKLPILSVVAIKERDKSGWRRLAFWRRAGFDVFIVNSPEILHFTREEKEAYDKALDEHELVMQVYGMCRAQGLRG